MRRLVAVLVLVVGACGSESREEEVSVSVEETAPEPTRIAANTQATFDDLRIGIGNIWEEEYTPEKGAARRGLTAGMWLYFRDDPSQDRHVRVHPGQRVTAGGRTIEVVTVDASSATLRVTSPPTPAKPPR